MSYKEHADSNNADLRTILDVVNGLPDKKITVTILSTWSGSSDWELGEIVVNGTSYKRPATIEVVPGTVVTMNAALTGVYLKNAETGTFDLVEPGSADGVTYTYTITEDTTMRMEQYYTGSYFYGYCYIFPTNGISTETESTFTPTDSGGTTYKSKFEDNNVDLQKMLDAVNALGVEAETVTITLAMGEGGAFSFVSIVHNGTTYDSAGTFEAKVGDTIQIASNGTFTYDGEVYINGEKVASGNPLSYTYTVASDAIFYVYGNAQGVWVDIYDDNMAFVEYLQSDGTQYINTGLYPTQNTRVVMDVQLTTYTSTSNQWLFGGRTASKNASFGFYHYKNYFGGCYGNEQYDDLSSLSALTRLSIDFYESQLTLNGDVLNLFNAEQTFTSTGALCLLARNTAGTVAAQASAKLYSCQVYENGVLVRDYRPVIDANGIACLFDKVNSTYNYNAGTGSFTAGPSL